MLCSIISHNIQCGILYVFLFASHWQVNVKCWTHVWSSCCLGSLAQLGVDATMQAPLVIVPPSPFQVACGQFFLQWHVAHRDFTGWLHRLIVVFVTVVIPCSCQANFHSSSPSPYLTASNDTFVSPCKTELLPVFCGEGVTANNTSPNAMLPCHERFNSPCPCPPPSHNTTAPLCYMWFNSFFQHF